MLISAATTVEIQWDSVTVEQVALYPIELPTADQAHDWWFRYWEGAILTCWYTEAMRVVLLAKDAVWEAIPEAYLLRPKADFVELDFALASDIVGEAEFGKLQWESDVCGISSRVITYEAAELLRRRLPANLDAAKTKQPIGL
ncbi:hypothetical protein NA78x_005570 [Anatilimnocola sp. NA78]|uniref:hypothetical protein n=1 Tax=Anatilimnocola sp. NA78 TaxID=3415683 RepID=UPI003CE58D97